MSFAETLRGLAANRGVALPPASDPEPLAGLDYALERTLKDEALARFWRAEGLPGAPEPLLPAPSPRGYRTTSKRRAVLGRGGVALSFPGAAPQPGRASPSALDLPQHTAAHAFLAHRLARPPARALAAALNWTIVRGAPGALAVILNLRVFDATTVRAAKRLAADLQEAGLGVRSGFLYLDPSGSEYYLEARRPAALSFKRLFGPEWLQVEAAGVRLRLHPTVFSQVNGAMVGTMTNTAAALLGPLAGCALLDLYCGYGLFALTAGRGAVRVTGVDVDGPAIAAARANAAHLGAGHVRFVPGAIDAAFLARLRPSPVPEAVLLDPPRQGTRPGVAAALAARRPLRAVHVCCGTDEIPREVAAWGESGYRLVRAVPLDLFAGTAGLETMLLLEPSGAGAPSGGRQPGRRSPSAER